MIGGRLSRISVDPNNTDFATIGVQGSMQDPQDFQRAQ
jgi:hypothetical protein